MHHPADILFASVAQDRADFAIGVVLSGGDGDGALGIQAIKQAGGITFAQEPSSARFPSMPQTSIDPGCVDFVQRPGEISRELMRLVRHPYLRAEPERSGPSDDPVETAAAAQEAPLRRIFRRLRSAHGVDFSHYKRSTLRRRLERRMVFKKIDEIEEYAVLLESDATETAALYQDFLIRVTGFFRDPESFEILAQRVFPNVCESRSPKAPVRIWVPGCASGEEVYSIAMALMEYFGERPAPAGIQIFGTDVSDSALEKARAGVYLENITQEVSAERLTRFFVKQNGHYRIAKSIRDLCVFARHDITRDPPFSKLDLASCRNLLIYLDASAQRRVMGSFHYALRPKGFLLLGPSETVGAASNLFEVTDQHHRLYTPNASATGGEGHRHGVPSSYLRPNDAVNGTDPVVLESDLAQREADRVLLTRFAPASVLIDDALNILQFRGETARSIAARSYDLESSAHAQFARTHLQARRYGPSAQDRAGGMENCYPPAGFMNPWEGRNYDMRVDRSLWPYIERYLTCYRHMLGGCRPELVFASSNTPDRVWLGLSQRMKALTHRNLRCPGVAPQDIRHIVASSIIEKTGNFRLAAAILHCSPAILEEHYSHLLTKFDSRNTDNFCMDCRVDTEKNREYYMLHHELWYSINRPFRGNLCLRCVERRLGRDLTSADFLDVPINSIQAKCCPGLARRLTRPA